MREVYFKLSDSKMDFAKNLYEFLNEYCCDNYNDIIILCIGSDRCTGDSLGPLVGHQLKRHLIHFKDVYVYGTLEEPVHAKNLKDMIDMIYKNHERPFIIAVDACLGKNINNIKIASGSMLPGAATNKDLPSVGDIHILGIVNTGGFMDLMVLQNTRLYTVMMMSEYISKGIEYTFWKKNHKNKIDAYN